MAIQYEPIPIESLAKAKCLQPHKMPEVLHLDDAALDAMYDFRHIRPLLIKETATLGECLDLLENNSRHLLIVVGPACEVLGIIRAADVQGTKPYQIMQEKQIKREDIPAKLLMIKGNEVLTFSYENLINARIGNVVITMQAHKKQYALVQETQGDGTLVIRGVYSISKIARALGTDLSSGLSQAQSIMELQRKLDK